MENRMQLIYDSASQLFINKGYARTQMKDIAKKIGLSPGMLYIYFTGKADILSFILKATIDPSFISREYELPIQSGIFSELDNEIITSLEENTKPFFSHLEDMGNYPFEQMLSDAFDVISKYGAACLMIEKNPDDLVKLAEFYQGYRKKFFKQVDKYVSRYIMLGSVRQVQHQQYVTRLIVETLSWWGMHIQNNAYEMDPNITMELAKSICLDNLLHAYNN